MSIINAAAAPLPLIFSLARSGSGAMDAPTPWQRLQLHRFPSNLTWATATNSTMSGIAGPGRLVGELIRSGGRRFEDGLGRAATRMGFGPHAAVWRFLVSIGDLHDYQCEMKLKFVELDRSSPVLLDTILQLRSLCARCCRPLVVDCEQAWYPDTLSKAAGLLLGRLLRYLQTGDLTYQLLSVQYLYAFAQLDWFPRNLLFKDWKGAFALQAALIRAETRALEGHVEWEALIFPTQQTLRLLNEDPEPALLVWHYLKNTEDAHNRHNWSHCNARLHLTEPNPSPLAMSKAILKLGTSCRRCHWSYYYSTSAYANSVLMTGLLRCLKSGDFNSRLLSAQCIDAFVASRDYLRNGFIEAGAGPALEVALKLAEAEVSDGHVNWEALVHPTKQALALLEKYNHRRRRRRDLDEDIAEASFGSPPPDTAPVSE